MDLILFSSVVISVALIIWWLSSRDRRKFGRDAPSGHRQVDNLDPAIDAPHDRASSHFLLEHGDAAHTGTVDAGSHGCVDAGSHSYSDAGSHGCDAGSHG